MAAGTAWIQELDCRAVPKDPTFPSERLVFRETLTQKSPEEIEVSRVLLRSWVGETEFQNEGEPTPILLREIRKPKLFPVLEPAPPDRFTLRLWRATRYSELSNASIPGDISAGIPVAEYRATVIEVNDRATKIRTLFTEKGGIRATGLWTINPKGQILEATVKCENAFLPGGDGSTYTYTIAIKKLEK